MNMSTFDRSGHQLTTYTQIHGNDQLSLKMIGFLSGATQVLAPLENNRPEDAALDIRDVATGKILKTITRSPSLHPHATNIVSVSHDQKHFAMNGDFKEGPVIFAAADGANWREQTVTKNKELHIISSLCFFPDDKFLAVGMNEGMFAVVDTATDNTIKLFNAYKAPFEGYDIQVDGIAVSPKGDKLLTGLGRGSLSGKALHHKMIEITGVSVWRISDGKQLAYYPANHKLISDVVWDPRDRFVAFADTDGLVLWQPQAVNEPFERIPLKQLSIGLAISPDGKSLAVAGEDDVIVYDIEDNHN